LSTFRTFRLSKKAKTGHVIYLGTKFRDNPICPHHGKKAIICEVPRDELGGTRWFCIDCVSTAIYETGDALRLETVVREQIRDLKALKKRGDLTENGMGQLLAYLSIAERMGWKVKIKL